MRNHYIRSVARRYYRALVPNFTGGFNGTADARTLPFSQGERAVGFDFSDGAFGCLPATTRRRSGPSAL